MSANKGKNGLGAKGGPVGEHDDYFRPKDERTKWQRIKDDIYNPKEGSFLGRTGSRWGVFFLFYLVFYAGLALLCAVCTMGLLYTIDEKTPYFVLEDSIIGTNPGLGFRPISDKTTEMSLIAYDATNSTQVDRWVKHLSGFLEKYENRSLLPNEGRDQVNCDYDKPPPAGKVCAVKMENWGPCKTGSGYGYPTSSPCVFIKLNRIFDWVPEYYENVDELPDDMPQDLKNHIKSLSINKTILKTVWISCEGENPRDKEIIGPIEYFPRSRGFAGYYYPYQNQPEYLSPVVAVHFVRPGVNEYINIECRAWAKNIIYRRAMKDKTGSVHFELRIDKPEFSKMQNASRSLKNDISRSHPNGISA